MNKTNKKTKFQYHLENIEKLDNEWLFLTKIPNFPIEDLKCFYSREDNSGWWMAIKQTALRGYINAYLSILGKKKGLKLFFVDPLSSYGLVRVTKRNGKDRFTFPGTSINASLISNQRNRGFDGFYINDINPNVREVLSKRMLALKDYFKDSSEIHIDTSNKKIDSNKWLVDVMAEIDEENRYYHCLIVIDNQAMDISYNTIQKIREISEFSDIIITFQDANIARAVPKGHAKIKEFFGCNVSPSVNGIRKILCDKYCSQLSKVDLPKIERMKVANENNFFYTLLFCCRENASGKWLDIVKYYNDERFKNFTDRDLKEMWDIVKGRQLSLDHNWK